MRRWSIALIAAASTIALTQIASAADLPVKAPRYAPPPPPLPLSWTGWYVGLNAGGDWGTSDSSTTVGTGGGFFSFAGGSCFTTSCQVNIPDVASAGDQSTDTNGFTGGGQAGFNWQTGNIVLGLETDFQYFRSAGSSSKTVPLISGLPGSVTVTSSMSTDWLFTLRPRLGWAVNNWLFYATGGLAVTKLNADWTFNETRFSNSAAGSASETKAGWTVGGGVEAMLPGRWVIGAEYLYVNFDDVSATAGANLPSGCNGPGFCGVPDPFTHSADLKANIVRARLSKLF